ncbi:lysine-2,3-aminomutase-like protein [Methylocystis heyeri]|uniref:Lysine-2,3-aminomutase-like protein n=1 Tax=Methylocystis heyeri TaxID=391905 RepID=A0A6B8KDY2_9HYPH|nr:lysine-2,3-aminomutase-like protein [Methylocystis heyeri]QGM44630.1 lysine-2,3-aminomutase-like protein [Methylocystis heyeri]
MTLAPPGIKKTLVSVDDLAVAGLAGPTPELLEVERRYSVAVTPQITDLIDRGDPDDPIARQFLPDARELIESAGELQDPIGDDAHSPMPGLVHRYRDRVLLKLIGVCPVYCRFCFRREVVGRGKGGLLEESAIDAAMSYIGGRPEIFEVILTGGDPFAAPARRLRLVSERLAEIEHVALLRVHTRAPTAASDLVTDARLGALAAGGKALHVALHVNHARELDAAARAAIERLHRAGASLLSQTVLLKGVNDDPATLETLLRALVSLRVKPYYLHHPDMARGTGHFRLSLDRGREIYAELARRIGGHSLPRYVLDLPGGFGKIPVESPHLVRMGEGRWRVVDRFGAERDYED